jgi:Dihydrodipicolinate synthase/N-acetylneuraminate lyase
MVIEDEDRIRPWQVLSLCSQLDHADFDVIVAGGSMRRHNLLRPLGVGSLLAGVGNLIPEVELGYVDQVNQGRLDRADWIIRHIETPFFDAFMGIGWHRGLRGGLRHLGLACHHDRQPWPTLSEAEAETIAAAIAAAQSAWDDRQRSWGD